MNGNICNVASEDGYLLHGMVCESVPGDASSSWVIHVHGSYGNFYENFFLPVMAEQYVSEGVSFVAINTRGHDYYADLKKRRDSGYESRRIGGIREIFQESVLDIAAWIRYARSRGARRVILQGHSLGAMKVAYYAWRGSEGCDGLVLISPPDSIGLQRADVG